MDYLELNNLKIGFLSLLIPLLLTNCEHNEKINQNHFSSGKKTVSFFCDFESNFHPENWKLKLQRIKKEKNRFEHFEKEQLYGHKFKFIIPDSFSNSSVLVKATFKYRNLSENVGKYVFFSSLHKDKGNLWKAKPLIGKAASDKWFVFSDSITVPANRKKRTSIELYPYNSNKAIFDLDSIKIEIREKKFPSSLGDIKKNFKQFSTIRLNSPIFDSVALFAVINNKFEQSSFNSLEDTLLGENNHLSVEANYSKQQETLLWNVKTVFKKRTKLNRLALIFKYKGEITEVYKNSRQTSEKIYGNEIWLGKEGFKITVDSLNWFCYGNKNVSSFQILKQKKLLIVNLDYSQDHPLYHFPELKNITNQKEDISANVYDEKRGLSLNNTFRFTSSKKIKSIPRILPTQKGFQAAFLWTEHADFGDIKLHKTTYYGDENASGPSEAKAGFAFHKIPVTKSVFYTINDTLRNNDYPSSFLTSKPTSIKKTPDFECFLDSLHSIGNEICLHTPDFYTSNEKTMEEALEYITKKYGSKTWIDHGYNNGHSDNREDFMCDGLNNYAVELWRRYNIKYFWNGYFEDTLVQNVFKSSLSRTVPFYGFEDQLPYPLFWENNKAPGLFSWRTSTVFYPKNGSTWNYNFSDEILNDFVTKYGIEFSHIYPAHAGHSGFWKLSPDSTFCIEPEFETTLKKMNVLREQGKLQLPTVSEFMSHQENLSLINYKIEKDKVIISNGGKDITGLTLVVKRKNLPQTFYTDFPNHRINGKDLIFWFDLKKGDKKIITF